MTTVDAFLRDAAVLAGMTADEVLTRVLHLGDGALAAVTETMDDPTRTHFLRLDHEIRLRNPGLHYVMRSKFIGYRREGNSPSPSGERSQIFASVIRNNSKLEVVLPVNPDTVGSIDNAQDLRGKGHHGVGDVRVSLRNNSDIDRLFIDFKDWLNPDRE
ncbi:MAG: hypothetical protein ACSLEW_07620 [Nocardioides sp.]